MWEPLTKAETRLVQLTMASSQLLHMLSCHKRVVAHCTDNDCVVSSVVTVATRVVGLCPRHRVVYANPGTINSCTPQNEHITIHVGLQLRWLLIRIMLLRVG